MTAIRQIQATEDPLESLRSRIDAIANRTLALLRAGTVIADIIASAASRETNAIADPTASGP